MNDNQKIDIILSTLSDAELSAVAKSLTKNVSNEEIKNQLLYKSNFDDFNFSRKNFSNSLINEFSHRLLDKNIQIGKKNKIVLLLKRLFSFRRSLK
jgi:hypothetical protein